MVSGCSVPAVLPRILTLWSRSSWPAASPCCCLDELWFSDTSHTFARPSLSETPYIHSCAQTFTFIPTQELPRICPSWYQFHSDETLHQEDAIPPLSQRRCRFSILIYIMCQVIYVVGQASFVYGFYSACRRWDMDHNKASYIMLGINVFVSDTVKSLYYE